MKKFNNWFMRYNDKIQKNWFSRNMCFAAVIITCCSGLIINLLNIGLKSIPEAAVEIGALMILVFVLQLFCFAIALINLIKYKNWFFGPWEEW